jgi:glycosyltransferase involved in cell wall biosynthesis
LKRSEKILVYSGIEKNKLIKLFDVPSYKIMLLPMAIQIEPYIDQPKEKTILFTGRIIPDKNPELLIKACALLNSRFNDYKLVFVGSVEENYKRKLIELSRRLGLRNEMVFTGQLDPSVEEEKQKLMRHYSTAAVFVSLGSWEGQPTRLMEAMQFKTPVIAFASGGTGDFVVHNVNGLIIQQLDEKLLTNSLERILTDEGLSKKLGDEARLTIERGYNWQKIFESIYEIYRNDSYSMLQSI